MPSPLIAPLVTAAQVSTWLLVLVVSAVGVAALVGLVRVLRGRAD